MITNFENITNELTDMEKMILPYVISAFSKRKKDNPIKAPEIIKKMNVWFKEQNWNLKMSEPRLRKMSNHIRTHGLLPLISTTKGYYTSEDKEEIKKQIESLEQRATSIKHSADGLRVFL